MSRDNGTPLDLRRSRSRPPGVTLAVVVVVVGVLVGGSTPLASASVRSTPAEPASRLRLHVADIDAVVGPPTPDTGSRPAEAAPGLPPPDVRIRLLVENGSDERILDVRLVVELEDEVAGRAVVRERLRPTASPVVPTEVLADEPLPPLDPGEVHQVELVLPGTSDRFVPLGTDLLRIRPLTVAALIGRTVHDEVRTAVVGVTEELLDAPRLETAVLLPIAHDPLGPSSVADRPTPGDVEQGQSASDDTIPDGDEDESPARPTVDDDDLVPGGRVDRLVAAAEAAPDGAVTVAPAAHTVELLDATEPLAGTGALLDRIRTLVTEGRAPLVSMPFALAEVPVLASTPASLPLADDAVREGRARLGSALDAVPDAPHLVVADQTAASLDLLTTDLVLTPWNEAAGAQPSSSLPPAIRTAVTPSGRTIRVFVADPWVTDVLAEATLDHGAAIEGHRAVIETAAMWAEQPTVPRALAVLPPVDWEAPGLVPSEVARRLAGAPWLRLASPAAVAQRASESLAGWRPLPASTSSLTEVVDRVVGVEQQLAALTSAVPEDVDAPVLSRGDEVLAAFTAWPTTLPVARADAVLDDLDTELDALAGSIAVPGDSAVTLASERGVVPVTVRRDAGPPLDVLVEVQPQGRLLIEGEPRRRVRLEQDGNATVSFDVRSLGTGGVPLSVTVRTPDGQQVLARGLVSVRATAVSTPALGAVALVIVLLLVLGRRRRDPADDERPRLEVVR